jgi:hypothetical protein
VEGDAAEAVARPGVEVQDDVGGVAVEVGAHLGGRELGVDVARLGGVVDERLLAALPLGMQQHVALPQREAGRQVLEARVVGAGAEEAQVHRRHPHRRPRVDDVAGHPVVPLPPELGVDDRPVVPERLQRLLDLPGRLGVELPHPPLVEVVGVGLAQRQQGQGVALEVAVDALDLDAHAGRRGEWRQEEGGGRDREDEKLPGEEKRRRRQRVTPRLSAHGQDS